MDHPYANIKEDGIWAVAYGGTPERQVAELNAETNTEQVIGQLEAAFQALVTELNELEQQITNAANKASFLSKLQNIRQRMPLVEALGDFAALEKRINATEGYLLDLIAENRRKNLQIKEALLEELEAAVDLDAFAEASKLVKSVKERWIKTGAVAKEHRDKVEGTFDRLMAGFEERRKAFQADKDKMLAHRKEEYEELIAKAKALVPTAADLSQQVDQLHQAWKAIGWVPPDQNKDLWQAFKEALPRPQRAKGGKATKKADKPKAYKGQQLTADAAQQLLDQVQALDLWTAAADALEALYGQLKGAKGQDTKAQNLLDQVWLEVHLRREAGFVAQQAQRRKLAPGSDQWVQGVRKIIRELISRDQSELATMEENLGRFSTGTDLADKLFGDKLSFQQRKVEVKKELLKRLPSPKKG